MQPQIELQPIKQNFECPPPRFEFPVSSAFSIVRRSSMVLSTLRDAAGAADSAFQSSPHLYLAFFTQMPEMGSPNREACRAPPLRKADSSSRTRTRQACRNSTNPLHTIIPLKFAEFYSAPVRTVPFRINEHEPGQQPLEQRKWLHPDRIPLMAAERSAELSDFNRRVLTRRHLVCQRTKSSIFTGVTGAPGYVRRNDLTR